MARSLGRFPLGLLHHLTPRAALHLCPERHPCDACLERGWCGDAFHRRFCLWTHCPSLPLALRPFHGWVGPCVGRSHDGTRRITAMRSTPALLTTLLLSLYQSAAQPALDAPAGTNAPPAAAESLETDTNKWSFAASVYTYV